MIPRRDVDFGLDPAAVPRDWADGCPYATTMLAALSLLFPEGERFFVDSVKQLRHRVEDPALREAIVGFIGQEAMHGREHRVLNDITAATTATPRRRWSSGGCAACSSSRGGCCPSARSSR
jgi:predicted metal-dependent hydrolase